MMQNKALVDKIFAIRSDEDFNEAALEVFRFQYENNELYRRFVDLLSVNPVAVGSWEDIPCLPIECFKNNKVVSFKQEPIDYFQSSATTSMVTSKHYFFTTDIYTRSFVKAFSLFWGDPSQYCILALLPNYLHQTHSSLIFMVRELIKLTGCEHSGFYDAITPELVDYLKNPKALGKKLILFGVSYSLLDLVESYDFSLDDAIVFETGGMKGRRKEMVREELHGILTKGLGVQSIASEYGMTELFTQAYSKGGGIYFAPPWMKVAIRDVNSPLTRIGRGRAGGLDVIDLANIYSCSFISTQDIGRQYDDGSFEVQGRFDYSDTRGCNLLSSM
jgi:hypothetical protein